MSVPAYPEYKDSGIAWLGDVPSHWDVLQSRRMFAVRSEPALEDDRMLTASQKYGVLFQADFTALEGRRVVEVIMGKDSLKHVEPNDFIISMRSFQGGLEWCKLRGSTSFHYVMVTPLKHVVPAFFAHLFKSVTYIQALRATTDLIRDGQELRYSNFVQVPLPVIPISEQQDIAAFLDRETAKIDALVAEQQRLIALLKEKRQAVISHAVTKGLNPNVPMKDSGIEWLGEIPAHWDVVNLKRLSVALCDGPFGSGLKSDHYVESGALVVRLQNIKEVGFAHGEPAYIDMDYFVHELSRHAVEPGDLLIAGLGDDKNLVGRSCVAPDDLKVAMVKADCFRFRLNQTLASPLFVAAQLNVSANFDAGQLATGTTRSRIPLSVMARRVLAIPCVDEQSLISSYCADATDRFDALTAEAQSAITLLQERRAALISAAVTGKIDVRGLVDTPSAVEAA